MGMPITIEVTDKEVTVKNLESIFDYFKSIDQRFSTYKETSEITKVNNGLPESKWSSDMKLVMKLCEETKTLTNGFFNIHHNGKLDPSGLVKGWSIFNASNKLSKMNFKNYYIEAGGDIQVNGKFSLKTPWTVGIRNPFNIKEIIKIVTLSSEGIATSGTYIRGQHIYNPKLKNKIVDSIQSLTVIAKNVYEADRYATAAFAMGKTGIEFLDSTPGLEGYMVDSNMVATLTTGFNKYVLRNA